MHVFQWHSHLHLWQRLVIWWKLTLLWIRRAKFKTASVSYAASLFFLLIYMGHGVAGQGGKEWMNRWNLRAFQSFIGLKYLTEWKKKRRKWMSEHLIRKLFREAIGRQKLVDLQPSKAQVSLLSPETISKKSATTPPWKSLSLFLAG